MPVSFGSRRPSAQVRWKPLCAAVDWRRDTRATKSLTALDTRFRQVETRVTRGRGVGQASGVFPGFVDGRKQWIGRLGQVSATSAGGGPANPVLGSDAREVANFDGGALSVR